jgi:hypothetical protein
MTARDIAASAHKFGIEVVDDPQIDAHEYHRNEMYRAIWEAIRLLAHLPQGRAVSIPKEPEFRKVISKKAHIYARRWGLNIVTRDAGDVIVVARKALQLNPTKGVVSVPENQPGGLSTSRGRSLKSGEMTA